MHQVRYLKIASNHFSKKFSLLKFLLRILSYTIVILAIGILKLFFFINLLRISVHLDWDFFAGRLAAKTSIKNSYNQLVGKNIVIYD
ncbi:hypothetical protein [Streptococcus mutans]|uniref:hypothetical protein n=1 Tax=Streptococcus mutans TaxID=1309 RepID=UPI0020D21142